MSAPDGLVVAIYGAWGLGKTTVLNFVEHYLHEDASDQFVVVRFNPWWFSGRVDIAAAFFEQLRAVFMSWPGRGEAERSHLARLAHVVGAATSDEIDDGPDHGIDGTGRDRARPQARAVEGAGPSGQAPPDRDRRHRPSDAGRGRRAVRGREGPCRLSEHALPARIRQGPGHDALRERSGQSGFNYLEKIVQVPFELPLPERESLRALFLEHLRGIVGDVDITSTTRI